MSRPHFLNNQPLLKILGDQLLDLLLLGLRNLGHVVQHKDRVRGDTLGCGAGVRKVSVNTLNTRYVPSTADSSVSPHSSVSEVADIRNTTLSHTWTQGGSWMLVQGLERCYLAHVQHGLDAVKSPAPRG